MKRQRKITPKQSIDLLFFDVTTLYFESQKADELRNFGYSKDGKKGEVQVMLALATTSNGLPIGYTLFPGNTGEVDTLLKSLDHWKKIFIIGEITVVADRAMMIQDNLKKMDGARLNYVVAAKLKSFPVKLKNEILSRKHEISVEVNKESMQVQEYQYKGRRLIVSFSEVVPERQRGSRKISRKLKSKLGKNNQTNPKKLITNNGYLKFVNEEREGKLILNEDKIIQDELWDGLHGIITSKREAPAEELLQEYRRLWVIEESFRINKHSLSMRPIYHFRTKRIQAHILICYLAFAVSGFTQERLRIFGEWMSVEKIREELLDIEISILEDKISGKFYQLPSKMSKKAKLIYRAIGAKRCDRPCEFKMSKNVVEQKKLSD